MARESRVSRSLRLLDLREFLSSASGQELLEKPMLRELMVEYFCWEQGMADWYARQPVRRQDGFATWIVEGRVLFDRLDELKQLALQVPT